MLCSSNKKTNASLLSLSAVILFVLAHDFISVAPHKCLKWQSLMRDWILNRWMLRVFIDPFTGSCTYLCLKEKDVKILLTRACVVKLKTWTVSNIVVINFMHTTVCICHCRNYRNLHMLMRRLAHDYDLMMELLVTTCMLCFVFCLWIVKNTEKLINTN